MIRQAEPVIEKDITALEGRGAADAGICALGMPRPCEHAGRKHTACVHVMDAEH